MVQQLVLNSHRSPRSHWGHHEAPTSPSGTLLWFFVTDPILEITVPSTNCFNDLFHLTVSSLLCSRAISTCLTVMIIRLFYLPRIEEESCSGCDESGAVPPEYGEKGVYLLYQSQCCSCLYVTRVGVATISACSFGLCFSHSLLQKIKEKYF